MLSHLIKEFWWKVTRINAALQCCHQALYQAAGNVNVDVLDVWPAVDHAGQGADVILMLLWSAHCQHAILRRKTMWAKHGRYTGNVLNAGCAGRGAAARQIAAANGACGGICTLLCPALLRLAGQHTVFDVLHCLP